MNTAHWKYLWSGERYFSFGNRLQFRNCVLNLQSFEGSIQRDLVEMAEDRELQNKVEAQIKECNNLIRSSRYLHAMRVFLDSPPYGLKSDSLKNKCADCMCEVLGAIRESEIDSFLDDLTPDQADVLLKYVYKGFEKGEISGLLLKWHANIVDRYGPGSIVRAMNSKRSV